MHACTFVVDETFVLQKEKQGWSSQAGFVLGFSSVFLIYLFPGPKRFSTNTEMRLKVAGHSIQFIFRYIWYFADISENRIHLLIKPHVLLFCKASIADQLQGGCRAGHKSDCWQSNPYRFLRVPRRIVATVQLRLCHNSVGKRLFHHSSFVNILPHLDISTYERKTNRVNIMLIVHHRTLECIFY